MILKHHKAIELINIELQNKTFTIKRPKDLSLNVVSFSLNNIVLHIFNRLYVKETDYYQLWKKIHHNQAAIISTLSSIQRLRLSRLFVFVVIIVSFHGRFCCLLVFLGCLARYVWEGIFWIYFSILFSHQTNKKSARRM